MILTNVTQFRTILSVQKYTGDGGERLYSQNSGERDRQISVSLRTAWSTRVSSKATEKPGLRAKGERERERERERINKDFTICTKLTQSDP